MSSRWTALSGVAIWLRTLSKIAEVFVGVVSGLKLDVLVRQLSEL